MSKLKNCLGSIAIIAFFVLLSLAMFSAPFSQNDILEDSDILAQPLSEAIEFEDAIARSQLIVQGKLVDGIEYDRYRKLVFEISSVIRGDIEDKTIYVYEYPSEALIESTGGTYITGDTPFVKNNEYILILEKNSSVYYEHDRYKIIGDIFIPADSPEKSTMYDLSIDAGYNSVEALSSYIAKVSKASPITREFYGNRFTDAQSLKEVTQYADCTLEVKIGEELYYNDIDDLVTYECEVLSSYKKEAEDDSIFIIFFGGTVKQGETYLVNVNQVEENSLIYNLAAKTNSLFHSGEKDIISEVLEIAKSAE